jgi:hypothetical protein
MAHWNEERDQNRIVQMRKCGQFAIKFKHLIDKYEEIGDDIYWSEFVAILRIAARK